MKEANVKFFEKPEFGKVRVVLRNGDPWFVAGDVATALGYTNPQKAVADHCKYTKLLKGNDSLLLTDSPRGINIIPESDVYALIFRSNLPTAEAFRRWVCEDVLPSIRKTGGYGLMLDPVIMAQTVLASNGLEGHQLALALDKVYRRFTGESALDAAEIQLGVPSGRQLLNVTEVGKITGAGSAQKVNKILESAGLQRKLPNGKWEPTEVGKRHGGVVVDVNHQHNDGSPARQLKWESSLCDLFEDGVLIDSRLV